MASQFPLLRGWCIHYIKAQVRLPIQVWLHYPGVNNVSIISLEVSASCLTSYHKLLITHSPKI